MKVKKIIIGKQFEICENYKEFIKVVNQKKIKMYIVESGNRINIENDLYFDIIWPDSNNCIIENSINNNSLVCKFVYKDFSMLFTGDIEESAENAILINYKNNLNSSILKVAHHGSKSSTSEKFLDAVSPKIALIGVGENNNFGHPNIDIIEKLKRLGIKIFRTDKNGEIIIKYKRINFGKIYILKIGDKV